LENNCPAKKWSQTACSEEREEEEKLLVPVSKQNKNEFNEPTTTHTNSRGEERRGEEVCALGADRLVIEHLSTQGRLDPREGLCVSGVKTKLEPLLLAHLKH